MTFQEWYKAKHGKQWQFMGPEDAGQLYDVLLREFAEELANYVSDTVSSAVTNICTGLDAVERKIGIDNSKDENSLDFRIGRLEGKALRKP